MSASTSPSKVLVAGMYLFVFACSLGFREYWLSQKVGLHLDESLSIVLSSYGDYGYQSLFPDGVSHPGRFFKEATFFRDESLAGAISDVSKLWWDTRDPPHSNLYRVFAEKCG